MNKRGKYSLKNKKIRNCLDCIHFQGVLPGSRDFFVCDAQMYEEQQLPRCGDIYDIELITKGKCGLFVPWEVKKYVPIHDYDAMDGNFEENDQDISGEE